MVYREFQIIYAIFRFYFSFFRRFDEIHPGCSSGRFYNQPKIGSLAFSASFFNEFNNKLSKLRNLAKKCPTVAYNKILVRSHCIRLLSCFSPKYGLIIGFAQFLIAPLSFPIAVMKVITYGPEGVIHYIASAALSPFIKGPCFTIDFQFTIMFLVTDQLLNLYFYLKMSEKFLFRRLLIHIIYGTMNTKLYYVIVFGALRGLKVDITLLSITSVVTLVYNKYISTGLLEWTKLPGHDVRFYLDHRLGHLPIVYPHAHKMHHHLHDSTAWDAHTYGNGMNEHYFLMILDALPCILFPSLVPYCFNWHLLYITWTNKPNHTRCVPGSQFYDEYLNFHCDHHKLHTKNFALVNGAFLDFYFGTQGPKARVKGLGGMIAGRKEVVGKDGKTEKIVVEINDATYKNIG